MIPITLKKNNRFFLYFKPEDNFTENHYYFVLKVSRLKNNLKLNQDYNHYKEEILEDLDNHLKIVIKLKKRLEEYPIKRQLSINLLGPTKVLIRMKYLIC